MVCVCLYIAKKYHQFIYSFNFCAHFCSKIIIYLFLSFFLLGSILSSQDLLLSSINCRSLLLLATSFSLFLQDFLDFLFNINRFLSLVLSFLFMLFISFGGLVFLCFLLLLLLGSFRFSSFILAVSSRLFSSFYIFRSLFFINYRNRGRE